MRKRFNKTPLSYMKFVYFRKVIKEQINQTIEQLLFFAMFKKYMKDAIVLHFTITLIKILFQIANIGFSIQHALSAMIEKMKFLSDNKKFCAAIFTDLSKAFDCICGDLLLAKLNAYRIDQSALQLIYDYLSDRSQKNESRFFVQCLFRHYLWCTARVYTWVCAVQHRSVWFIF